VILKQPWPESTPADGERITDILKIMAPMDFFSAAVGTANFRNNGMRDLIDCQQALRARIFAPNHQTTGGSDVGETKAMTHYAIYLQQLRNMGVPENEWPNSRTVVPACRSDLGDQDGDFGQRFLHAGEHLRIADRRVEGQSDKRETNAIDAVRPGCRRRSRLEIAARPGSS
jgi:hypothetical protein